MEQEDPEIQLLHDDATTFRGRADMSIRTYYATGSQTLLDQAQLQVESMLSVRTDAALRSGVVDARNAALDYIVAGRLKLARGDHVEAFKLIMAALVVARLMSEQHHADIFEEIAFWEAVISTDDRLDDAMERCERALRMPSLETRKLSLLRKLKRRRPYRFHRWTIRRALSTI